MDRGGDRKHLLVTLAGPAGPLCHPLHRWKIEESFRFLKQRRF
jgi:hypothetical protein